MDIFLEDDIVNPGYVARDSARRKTGIAFSESITEIFREKCYQDAGAHTINPYRRYFHYAGTVALICIYIDIILRNHPAARRGNKNNNAARVAVNYTG